MTREIDYQKLGHTTWRTTLYFDNGHESFAGQVAGPDLPNMGLAKAWVNRNLPLQRILTAGVSTHSSAHWWGRIERGTYVDDSFTDVLTADCVLNADWEKDSAISGAELYAIVATDGDLIWSES